MQDENPTHAAIPAGAILAEATKDFPVCGAKTRDGSPCLNAQMPNGRCRMHGGTSTGTPLKTGRYSKHLNSLRGSYQDSLNDQTLLDMREQVALLDAIVQQVAVRAENGDTPEFRRRSLTLYQESVAASKGGDHAAAASKLQDLGRLLRDGVSMDHRTTRLARETERLHRMISSVWQVKMQRRNSLSISDLRVLQVRQLDIVQRYVDAETFRRIVVDLDREMVPRGSGNGNNGNGNGHSNGHTTEVIVIPPPEAKP